MADDTATRVTRLEQDVMHLRNDHLALKSEMKDRLDKIDNKLDELLGFMQTQKTTQRIAGWIIDGMKMLGAGTAGSIIAWLLNRGGVH